ncbi:MAG: hypothetical protein QF632_02110 [Candidatus Woesearchaeota archaeon]|jgi:hypothetical protein|nr:hypothetical protein [Candidatus Woesearchaeota archaeon]MDP7323535.1 hypothetical protein [Candidatus Woesearchaeota archaeon]MDP7457731.1 hypothetical protein [Candidatus Woesearchaeota archaeon]
MGVKTAYNLFVLVAIVLGIGAITYFVYEEPQVYESYMPSPAITGGASYVIDGSDYWGKPVQRKWVSGSADNYNRRNNFNGYYGGYGYGSPDYYDRPGYFIKSNVCRDFYDDPQHPLNGECRQFTDFNNEHRVKRCNTFCDRDFDIDFQKCDDTYDEGSREYHHCIDFYEEKFSNSQARCVAECPL